MCTVVVLVRPGHAWPLLLAANRDEMVGRPWDAPAAWWPDQPDIVAPRDRTAGGTWLGMNRQGVVAAVLNRPGSLGPAPGRTSRGGLPLLALSRDDAADGCAAVCAVDAAAYRSFNMVIADAGSAWFVRGMERGRPTATALDEGLHMVTAHDPNDDASPRTARHLPRFRAAIPPRPEWEEWLSWERLLADRSGPSGTELNVPERGGFATICSSLIGIPARPGLEVRRSAIWRFAAGPPDQAPFERVDALQPAV